MRAVHARKPETDPIAGTFGFDPKESVTHFLVNVPVSNRGNVEISEHLSWDEATGSSPVTYGSAREDGQLRALLPRAKWDAIADPVRVEFNQRLRPMGKRPGNWKTGPNLVARLLGKELTLLAWAIEDADPSLVPVAVANWQGLTPEERWWLYTMTAAATGNFNEGKGRGWRKAVRFALTENPVGARVPDKPIVPEFFLRVEGAAEWGSRAKADADGMSEPER